MLAGRAPTARHSGDEHLSLRGANRLDGKTGRNNPNKLYATDIAETIMAALNMHSRALWVELAIFANNPWKEE